MDIDGYWGQSGMSTIAAIEVDADDFILGGALSANHGIRVRLERVIPIGETVIPYFWVSGDSREAIESALDAEADIETSAVVDTLDGEVLVKISWVKREGGLLDMMIAADATILEAIGEDGRWSIRLRFDDHQDLTAFYRGCVDRGISLDIGEVHNPATPYDSGLGITDVQRETLLRALEMGYFAVPRRTNLTELADELDISDTAVSQRLRRGIGSVLGVTLRDPPDPPTWNER